MEEATIAGVIVATGGIAPTAMGQDHAPASIAACHARAVRPEHTDWAEIVRLYEFLEFPVRSPGLAL